MIEGICSDKLYAAILQFQRKNFPKAVTGHVDPSSPTFNLMERMVKISNFIVDAKQSIDDVGQAIDDAIDAAARRQAAIDTALKQMTGNEPGSENWAVDGSDAPLSGAVPYAAGPGVASVARIPVPGTDGLAIELSPRGYVPKGGSTSTIFIQDVTGKKHLRLDYGYNKNSGTVDYHWNQKGTNAQFGITDHTTVGTKGKIAYNAAKYLKWGGRVLLVVGLALDIWSIVKSSKPLRRTAQVAGGWAGAWAGCEVGGEVLAVGGSVIEPGGGTAVGGVLGCIGGGIGGYIFGSKVGGYVYDWAEDTFFSPLPAAESP
jgi:hypothetical protein